MVKTVEVTKVNKGLEESEYVPMFVLPTALPTIQKSILR